MITTRIFLLSLFLMLSCVSAGPPAPTVAVVSRSTDQRVIVPSTQHELWNRYMTIVTRFEAGHERRWDIQVAYSDGRYWWWWQPALDLPVAVPDAQFPGGSSVLHVDADRIAVITPLPGPALAIRAVSSRAVSLDDAERQVMVEITRRPSILSTSPSTTVALQNALGADFGVGEGSAVIRAPRIEGVAREDGRWRIALRGANGDRAELIISDDYQFVEARKP